ncbi:MAG: MFS transporter, partial [Halanaerobiaceae bacterium]
MTLKEHIKESLSIHSFGHAYNDIYFFIIPLLLPFLRAEFNLSYTQAGFILTLHVGLRSLFSYVSGHLGDCHDKRIIIAAGFFIASFSLAALMWTNSIYGIIACFLLMAVGVAAFHPLATALVGEAAHSKYRAFHIGLFETAGAMGIMVATFTFGFLVEGWGWR